MKRPGLLFIFLILTAGVIGMIANMILWPKHLEVKTEPAKPAEAKKADILALVEPKSLAKVGLINELEKAGKVTLAGKSPDEKKNHVAQLEKGAEKSPFFECAAPFLVESVLVEVEGKSLKNETVKTLESGKEYKLRVKSDLSVEWIDPPAPAPTK